MVSQGKYFPATYVTMGSKKQNPKEPWTQLINGQMDWMILLKNKLKNVQ
jgi:hypothetical protein